MTDAERAVEIAADCIAYAGGNRRLVERIATALAAVRAEQAERITTLERENERLRADLHGMQDGALLRDLKAENARLNNQIAEWSRANLAIVAKCSSVEKQNAERAERIATLERERDKWHSDACTQMNLRVTAERERDEARAAAEYQFKERDLLFARAERAEARLAQACAALRKGRVTYLYRLRDPWIEIEFDTPAEMDAALKELSALAVDTGTGTGGDGNG